MVPPGKYRFRGEKQTFLLYGENHRITHVELRHEGTYVCTAAWGGIKENALPRRDTVIKQEYGLPQPPNSFFLNNIDFAYGKMSFYLIPGDDVVGALVDYFTAGS